MINSPTIQRLDRDRGGHRPPWPVRRFGLFSFSDEVDEHIIFDGATHESWPGIPARGAQLLGRHRSANYHVTG